jgi:CRP-like cAMP-binding protein
MMILTVLDHHDRLVRQLETIAFLDEDEKRGLKALPLRIRDIAEDRDIVRQGERPTECCLILDGLAARYKLVLDGRRQILSLHFAGDMPDLHSLHLDVMDHGISALTTARVAFVPHDAVRALIRQLPRIGEVLTRHALIDASIFREWIANVGRRPARERVAHVFCEVFVRMRALGITDEDSFRLPMTQAELGDATGLSPVHINRTLQQLRLDKLLRSRGEVHTVIDWERLRDVADFDLMYLHLKPDRDDSL